MVCNPCPPWNPHLISPFTLPCRTQCARTSSSAHTKPLPSHPAPSKIFQARKGCHGRAWAAMANNILRELHSRRAPISHRSGHYEFTRATVSPRVRTSKPIILLSCRNHSTSPLFRPRTARRARSSPTVREGEEGPFTSGFSTRVPGGQWHGGVAGIRPDN